MQIRPAINESEVDFCLDRAKEIFSSSAVEASYKNLLWKDSPCFSQSDVILITHKHEIYGFLRIIPSQLFIPAGFVSSAGLSSISILPKHRGKGLSKLLMEGTLQICRERGYELAHLIARRSVDFFYSQFGFFGLSSYERLILKYDESKFSRGEYQARDCNEQDLDFCSLAYVYSYKDCYGRFLRSRDFWAYCLARVNLMKNLRFEIVIHCEKRMAYVIRDQESVLEIGIIGTEINIIDLTLLLPKNENKVKFNLPATHVLNKHLSPEIDVTFEERKCLYGGHMVCDLRSPQKKDLAGLEKHFLNNLGISVAGLDKSMSFNISFLDQL